MTPHITSDRFDTEQGHEIAVQVPLDHAAPLLAAITKVHPLNYGPFDTVSFQSEVGQQRFRSVPGGRNKATEGVVSVPCVELRFFVSGEVRAVLEAIYAQHPYEEPVIFVRPSLRTLHCVGMDEDNPNKFWNRPAEDWIPEEHRPD